jgi:hypothetical protein
MEIYLYIVTVTVNNQTNRLDIYFQGSAAPTAAAPAGAATSPFPFPIGIDSILMQKLDKDSKKTLCVYFHHASDEKIKQK